LTTQDDDIRDGFRHSVADEPVGSIALMYGVAPDPWPPNQPQWPTPPAQPFVPPVLPPNVVISPGQPKPYTLTVRGPDGFELKISLSAEEWAALRPSVLGAVK
jgi:hypothetical protein